MIYWMKLMIHYLPGRKGGLDKPPLKWEMYT